RLTATLWLTNSSMWRRAPEPADLDRLLYALALDESRLVPDGRCAITVRRRWTEIDGPGLRSALLSAVAAGWRLRAGLEAVADDLPGDDPLAMADAACRLAERSAYPEWIDQARFFRGWCLVGTPDAQALLEAGEHAVQLGYTFSGGGWSLKAL